MTELFVIAEAGVNHNGDPALALELVDVAAESGADADKFQTFRAEALVTTSTPMAEYQQRNLGHKLSQHEMLRGLELHPETHFLLQERADARGIQFLSTPFDVQSLNFLVRELRMSTIKVPSGEITNHPFLLAVARQAEHVILSTGASTMPEVSAAVATLSFGFNFETGTPPSEHADRELDAVTRTRLTILHAVTAYPAPSAESNLRVIPALRAEFDCRVGLSDHSLGSHVSMAAVALGAQVIEKHFTLDRSLPGPDHAASLTPTELSSFVNQLRETSRALGDGVKRVQPSETKNQLLVRRSLIAIREISPGETFDESNVAALRPGTQRSPADWWKIMGATASKRYHIGETIDEAL